MATGRFGLRIMMGLAFLLALLAGGGNAALLTAQGTPTPAVTVAAENRQPAAASRYTVSFTAAANLPPGAAESAITLTLHQDIGVAPQLNPQGIRITASQVADLDGTERGAGSGFPIDLLLAGQDNPRAPTMITLSPGDLGASDGIQQIVAGARVTITFSAQAGLSNPAEGGPFSWTVKVGNAEPVAAAHPDALVRQAFGESTVPATDADLLTGLLIDREVILSDASAIPGTEIVAIGRGFKNDTTLTFWRDGNLNGARDGGENILCVANVGRDDIGSCNFALQSPPFAPGNGDCLIRRATGAGPPNCNLVNAMDGRGQSATVVMAGNNLADSDDAPILELDGLVRADFGSGHSLLIHLAHFPAGRLSAVEIGGQSVAFPNLSVGPGGALSFSIDLPADLRSGHRDLRVAIIRQDNGREYAARATIVVVSGPVVRVMPEKVLPNQRLHLTGSGFTQAAASPEPVAILDITINGREVPARRIWGDLAVDSNGSWSVSVDLPVNRATTTPGDLEIRVRDNQGRAGSAVVAIAPRQLTVAPLWARAGSAITVAGRNFPSRNDQASGLYLRVIYDAGSSQSLATAEADGSGNFQTEIRVPRGAGIPSTNQVRVEFLDDDGVLVSTTAAHDVPGAAVSLAPNSGPPGTLVTVSGQGFREFAPAQLVKVGSLEVTPTPRPATDALGQVTMQIRIPGLEVGVQTVALEVSGVTASADFTLTPAGVVPGLTTPTEAALASLGTGFRRIFHFNNATKGWTFYDPEVADASTLNQLTAGESYWILVSETAEAILNGKTRKLSCAAGNCWNLLVW